MQPLAHFIMRGRSQAAMIVTIPALLALVLPALGIVSSAALALVTLRNGVKDGLVIMALSSVISAIFAFLLFGHARPVLGFFVALWLPMWILGLLLRASRSLSLTVQVALIFGVILILVLRSELVYSQSQLIQMLQPLSKELVQSGMVGPKEGQDVLQILGSWVIGILAAGFYLQLLLALFLARSWQARLYNPGGFVAEFQSMRAHSGIAALTVLLLVLLVLPVNTVLTTARDFMLLILPLWFICGLAVTHGIIAQAGLSSWWLLAVYASLLVAAAPVIILLVAIGMVDAMVGLRDLLSPKSGADQ